jgi:hypothetical protein
LPTSTETRETLFKHCNDPLCRGHAQKPIPGVVTENSWTYAERGGDLPGVENSTRTYRPENEADYGCHVCGRPASVTDQVRPVYDNLSGHPASESVKYFGTYRAGEARSAEVDEQLERLEDAIGGN